MEAQLLKCERTVATGHAFGVQIRKGVNSFFQFVFGSQRERGGPLDNLVKISILQLGKRNFVVLLDDFTEA